MDLITSHRPLIPIPTEIQGLGRGGGAKGWHYSPARDGRRSEELYGLQNECGYGKYRDSSIIALIILPLESLYCDS